MFVKTIYWIYKTKITNLADSNVVDAHKSYATNTNNSSSCW